MLVTISVHIVLCAKAHRCTRATNGSLRQQKGFCGTSHTQF